MRLETFTAARWVSRHLNEPSIRLAEAVKAFAHANTGFALTILHSVSERPYAQRSADRADARFCPTPPRESRSGLALSARVTRL
jgi:hypothetical protein